MSAIALISGRLVREAECKISSNNNTYCVATIKVVAGDQIQWWRAFVFNAELREELLALSSGDAISVSGLMKAEIFKGTGEAKISLSITADRLISARQAKRKKAGSQRTSGGPKQQESAAFITKPKIPLPPDDGSIPF